MRMKAKNSGKSTVVLEKPANNAQLRMIVDGCKVKMNFPSESEKPAINDIKRMMLGGVTKP